MKLNCVVFIRIDIAVIKEMCTYLFLYSRTLWNVRAFCGVAIPGELSGKHRVNHIFLLLTELFQSDLRSVEEILCDQCMCSRKQ